MTESALQQLRETLAHPATSLQLCLVGVIGGIAGAAVIILFKACIYLWHTLILGGYAEYQNLAPLERLFLPIGAILVVILIATLTGYKHYRLGIPFVIHRLKIFYGHIPFLTTINQFFGGVMALGSGFVLGKEGPTVHLAAASSHYVGRWLGLPFNSLRILAGCGISAGIAAAFNTPFAAVIFVMEVVLREYKVHIFVPVMLAAACGSVITRSVFGDVSELGFLTFTPVTNIELLYLVVFGIVCGILASLFNSQLMALMRLCRPLGMLTRLLLAAAITGGVAYFYPQALGAEFINISAFIGDDVDVKLLAVVLLSKLFLAVIAIALGVPGGIMGAVMVIGILLGSLLFVPVDSILQTDNAMSYALLGLAGFLAAVLHAPMAALSAAMELAANSGIILPAIIVIVSAYVTSKQFCKNRSIFIQQLDYQGLSFTTSLVRDSLQQSGVMSLAEREFGIRSQASDSELYQELQASPDQIWLHRVYDSERESHRIELISLDVSLQDDNPNIHKEKAYVLSQQHTLADAYEVLYSRRNGAVVIVDWVADTEDAYMALSEEGSQVMKNLDLNQHNILGVITWNMLHTYMIKRQH